MLMRLKILLPFEVFLDTGQVTRLVVETKQGSFGLLPRRLDCVAALAPGILAYETIESGEVYVGIDEGVLIKTASEVRVSVRNAIAGADLRKLRDTVQQEFVELDEREHMVRSALAKMESGLIRRMTAFYNE
jgi:F-type H+-transporting ATPase subunit epsilon